MRAPAVGWENLLHHAGGPENVLLTGFKNDKLKPLTGKTLAEVARMRGTSPEDTIIDLVIEDDSRVDDLQLDRKGVVGGKRVSGRLYLGGGRIIKTKIY